MLRDWPSHSEYQEKLKLKMLVHRFIPVPVIME
jgi:hypothetical protein